MEFGKWLNKKFSDWRGETRKGVTDFAAYIGVSHPVMSNWLNGKSKKPPSPENIGKLADKYPDVYDVLGLPRPQAAIDVHSIAAVLSKLPPGEAERFVAAYLDFSAACKAAGIEKTDPASKPLFEAAFKNHGLKVE